MLLLRKALKHTKDLVFPFVNTIIFILLAHVPANANRAVMEGIAASSSTIYIDTVNVRVGISTGIPQDTLDVNGSVRVSSAVRLGATADPGTYGFILTSSGPGLAPFWNPPTSYGYIYYFTATPSATTPFKLMTSTGQALISTDTFTAADDGVIISTFITPSNQPGISSIPSGRYVAHVHAARTAGTKDVYISAQVWEYTSTGGVVGMIGQTGLVGPITSSNLAYDSIWTSGSEYILASTSSRIAVKIKLTVSGGGSAPDVAIYYGDDTDSHIAFPANSANLSGYVLKSGDTMTGALTVSGTSVTASAFFGDGSHLTGVTGSHVPTRQVLTSSSGVYYSTDSTGSTPIFLVVRFTGAGGGGGGVSSSGGNGGNTTFGTITATGGSGGIHTTGTTCTGAGAGGTGGSGGSGIFTSSAVYRWDGQPGGCSQDGSGTTTDQSGAGGGTAFWGGGAQSSGFNPFAAAASGISAVSYSGGGGSGCAQDDGCSGGGGGESVELMISSPSASYSYSVGTAGTAGTGSPGGGAGGSARIIVDEYY